MSKTLERPVLRRVIVTQQKTVAQLLTELELSDNHVVLHRGERMGLDDLIDENDEVVVLPLIEGG